MDHFWDMKFKRFHTTLEVSIDGVPTSFGFRLERIKLLTSLPYKLLPFEYVPSSSVPVNLYRIFFICSFCCVENGNIASRIFSPISSTFLKNCSFVCISNLYLFCPLNSPVTGIETDRFFDG